MHTTKYRSRLKTVITTPFGSFEFLVIPFGLRDASQTYQRLIDCVLRCLDICCSYGDNILIASKNEEKHRKHLEFFSRYVDAYALVVDA